MTSRAWNAMRHPSLNDHASGGGRTTGCRRSAEIDTEARERSARLFVDDFDAVIRRHWALAACAFTFCWHARPADPAPPPHLPPTPADADGAERGPRRRSATRAAVLAPGRPPRPRLADPLRTAATLVAKLVEQAPAR
ncbi:hypothetical protein ACQPYK_28840 [Streptosporangium sp. CA-135522]|uniref:hypothetical protein n=1 Tax=Streptosporangium sp. CA-135522 TaxID=3240072 RepID=UPI003D8E6254